MRTHVVVIPLFPGIQPLDVVGPHEVFVGARRLLTALGGETPAYDVRLVAATPGPVPAESGLQLVATGSLPPSGRIGTLLVPGGSGVNQARHDETLVAWIAAAARRADRVASVCSGAFLLAAAGLLDGHPVATHWARAEELTALHPELDVQVDPIYIRSGDVWTSAGVTAGLDLALAMVEDDHGADVAQTVARHLVMFVRRAGGQSQFASPVWSPPAPRPSVRHAQDLVHADPAADHRVPALAARVGMSPRHFSREFTRLVGAPPGDYVERVRVETARRLLESEPVTVATAAARAGFGSAETMRRAFIRRIGVPPDHYRRRFSLAPT